MRASAIVTLHLQLPERVVDTLLGEYDAIHRTNLRHDREAAPREAVGDALTEAVEETLQDLLEHSVSEDVEVDW